MAKSKRHQPAAYCRLVVEKTSDGIQITLRVRRWSLVRALLATVVLSTVAVVLRGLL
jgi:hypothetical protein